MSAASSTAAKEPRLRAWLADLVHAMRALVATPRYSVPAFVSLALGIGASTAVLAIFSAVSLRPLPYPRDAELVNVRLVTSADGGMGMSSLSYPYYPELSAMKSVLSSVAIWSQSRFTITGMGDALHATGASVSKEFFDTLQPRVELGRTFTAAGPAPDGDDVVVVSHSFWKRELAGGDVVGRGVVVNGHPRTIVGVLSDDVAFPAGAEIWTPIRVSEDMKTARDTCFLQALGRLAPGVTFPVGSDRVEATTKAQNIHFEDGALVYLRLQELRKALLGDRQTSALLMVAAVAAFLLLACANVAALLVTRASVRSRELAVRAALGAGPWDLARQTGLEAAVLATVSGAVGLAMSAGLVHAANVFYAGELAYAPARLDAGVLAAFVAVAVVATIAVGLAPTLYALRVRPMDSLRADGRSSSSRGARHVREGLIAVQVAITLALLVSASMLVRSVKKLDAVSPGFDMTTASAQIGIPLSKQKEPAQRNAFWRDVEERAEHLPGVTDAAIAGELPFDQENFAFNTETEPDALRNEVPSAAHFVSAGYFKAMGIPILAGHTFPDTAGERASRIVVVTRAFAMQYYGTLGIVGHHISLGYTEDGKPSGAKIWLEIVGLVEDTLDEVLTAPPQPTIYLPFASPENPRENGFTLVARGPLETSALLAAIARLPREIDRDATVWDVEVLRAKVERSYRQRVALEQLLAIFAFASIVLAAIGLFGVTSYAVAERSGEIGIRRALGASRGDIIAMILGETGLVVALGMVGGVACALGTRTLLASFLYGVVANDVLSYASMSVGVFAMAMLAALAPARAAARVTPSRALEVR